MVRNALRDLLKSSVSRLYAAEHQLKRILPQVSAKVSCVELREALMCFVAETDRHIQRLEVVAETLSWRVSLSSQSGIEGLLRDLVNVSEESAETNVIDVALVAALRRIEFCQISSYETARSIAEALGEKQTSIILEDNLQEEEVTERFFTVLNEELIDDEIASWSPAADSLLSVNM